MNAYFTDNELNKSLKKTKPVVSAESVKEERKENTELGYWLTKMTGRIG